jgi:hypothetical protein
MASSPAPLMAISVGARAQVGQIAEQISSRLVPAARLLMRPGASNPYASDTRTRSSPAAPTRLLEPWPRNPPARLGAVLIFTSLPRLTIPPDLGEDDPNRDARGLAIGIEEDA